MADKFDLTPLGKVVWEDRYALKDDIGNLVEKDITETFRRIAKAIASKEKDSKKWEDEFYWMMANRYFCPAGRILAHAGTHYSQLLNCFVLPFRSDSLEEIMHTASDMAIIQKFGGGCIGGESLVLTNKGSFPIKKLVEDKDPDLKVLSYNEENGETEYCAVLDYHTTPISGDRVYEIEFGVRGLISKMRASDWHPFFVFDGEKVIQVRADELKDGMCVIGSSGFLPDYDPWSWLIGYVAGDGAISPNGDERYTRIRIVDQYKACADRAATIMEVPCEPSKDERYQVPMWECTAYADTADRIREEFGGHQTSATKHVPSALWGRSPQERFSFIVGYLDADGWFNEEKERFEAFSVSKELIDGIVAVAGGIGLRSSVRFRGARKPNEKDGWEVRFCRSRHLTEAIKSVSAKYGEDLYSGWACGSVTLSETWKPKLMETGVNLKSTEAWRGVVKIGESDVSIVNWLQRGKTTRDTAADIIKTCGNPLLANSILSSQIVRAVKATHKDEVLYDLTVDKNQNYLASDPSIGSYVVVHNTGFNYSTLRPEGSYIKGVNGRSCGIIGFISMMSTVSEVIEQGGSRRGANLGIVDIGHPDIWEFISYKTEHNWEHLREFVDVRDQARWDEFTYENMYKWQMYNVSVGINDEFLEAVKSNSDWTLKWNDVEWKLYKVAFKKHQMDGSYTTRYFEVTADSEKTALWKVRRKVPYPTADDVFEVSAVRNVKATEIWDRLCYNAWADGCPGLINLSTVRNMHNLEYANKILASNPCGEQPLPQFGSCNLASIVLPSFLNKKGDFDYTTLEKVIRIAVRFMDNVIDNCNFPLKEIEKVAKSERRIGLGTMGIHDLLMAFKKGYDTPEGRNVAENVLSFIRDTAYKASIELAKEKGSFPAFNKNKFIESGFVKTLPEDIVKDIYKTGIRNGALLSQAPTGTIGSMYNVSTGCEPWFALIQQLNTRLGSYESGCPAYLEWRKDHSGEEKPSYFKTAGDISPEDHVKMMIIFSRFVDSAVSKTVNLPSTATVDDVKTTFLMAMDSGVKGMTVFRDGCKKAVLVNKEKEQENGSLDIGPEDLNPLDLEDAERFETRTSPLSRGNRTVGGTTRIHMDKHNMYVTVNKNYEGQLVEIFVTVGTSKEAAGKSIVIQTSGVENSWANAVSKITSLALRAGVKPESIIKNLKNIPSDKPTFVTICDGDSVELIPSPPHAVGRVIEEELKYTPQNIQIKDEDLNSIKGYCTNCGSTNITWRTASCGRCNDCGNDDCGSLRRTN